MKIHLLIIAIFIFSTLKTIAQDVSVTVDNDTTFSYIVTSDCKNSMDYPNLEAGYDITWWHLPGIAQIKITIEKNCGQTTIIDIESQSDTIYITRTDTGQLATCNCFQQFELSINNLYDSVLFVFFGHEEKLINSYYVSTNKNISISNYKIFFNQNSSILEVKSLSNSLNDLLLEIIDLKGRVLLSKRIKKSNNQILLNLTNGLYLYRIKGDRFVLSDKIMINNN